MTALPGTTLPAAVLSEAAGREPVLGEAVLPGLSVPTPAYDRRAVVPSVVHLGVGNFHRSHQAVVLDRVLAAGDLGWGVCGVGLLPGDAGTIASLQAQDGLYTLVTVEPDGSPQARVVGSLVDVRLAPEDPAAVLERLADPVTRIVTLTITEGGYGVDDATGQFRPDDPLILADLDGGAAPRSAVGYLVEALRLRRDRGTGPFTVVSCDNLQGNGQVARTAVLGLARARDPELAGWIAASVPFPSSMVDRITPATTDADRALVRESAGVEDRCPVRSESYLQWVLEDDFAAGRPDLGRAGVQLVEDVAPYELMKLRLLNASHQAIGYLGLLAGYEHVHEVCRDPGLAGFLRRYMDREARPTLAPVPGVDLDDYCTSLLTRFSGDALADTLRRQVVDGSERLAKFLVPVLRDQLAAGGDITCCATVLAAWGRHLDRHLEPGAEELPDRRAAELLELAARERHAPGALLDLVPVFGGVGAHPRLRTAYTKARHALEHEGARDVAARLGAADD
ncbi:MAG: mannitol dehydrogenase [Acidobacteria bacterium]|nr:MAG: mannitol dehydrogenase [Acidobacteriota bacterium]